MKTFQELIKYIDTFGAKYHFYINKKPRYYTIIGGILSFLSFIACLQIFILATLKRLNPSITTTILFNSEVNIEKDKLWLPWRISDDNNKYINYSNIIVYYSSGDSNFKIMDYKVCNETSLIITNKINKNNKTVLPSITDLYCIDLGDIINNNLFISTNIIFNLFLSNDIINNYSSLLNNNSIKIELFYPILEFEPDIRTEPLLNIYQKHSIYFKRNTLKKEKITLQECSVIDKFGFFREKEKIISLWGINSFYNENIKIDNNINNEIIPFYSLNILLDIKKIFYRRYHKNIIFIIIEVFPLCYIIFKVMKWILNPFILAESNCKIFELLFEKLVEKENKSELLMNKMRFKSLGGTNLQNMKESNNIDNIDNILNKEIPNMNYHSNKNKKNIEIVNYIKSKKKYRNDDIDNENNLKDNEKKNEIDDIIQKSQKSIKFPISWKNNHRRSVDYGTHNINSQKNNNLFLINQNILINKNYQDNPNQLNGSKINILPDDKVSRCSRYNKHSTIKISKLFPYKYYFFSTFLKNYEIFNCKYLFSIKYQKVFTFINQLLDINAYLLLKKEFEIMKHIYCSEDDLVLVEKNKKININNTKFTRDIKDCIDKNKFYIFYQKAK